MDIKNRSELFQNIHKKFTQEKAFSIIRNVSNYTWAEFQCNEGQYRLLAIRFIKRKKVKAVKNWCYIEKPQQHISKRRKQVWSKIHVGNLNCAETFNLWLLQCESWMFLLITSLKGRQDGLPRKEFSFRWLETFRWCLIERSHLYEFQFFVFMLALFSRPKSLSTNILW